VPQKENQFRSLIAASGQIQTGPNLETAAASEPPFGSSSVTARARREGKRRAPGYTQVGAYIPKNLHNQVKVKLLQEGDSRNFSDLIEGLLSDYVAQRHIA
jgi:hypothetical protein